MSDELYYVQAIRNWRYNIRLKRREYLIKWRGYSEKENTWEPEDYLECPIYLGDFERKLKPVERSYYDCHEPTTLSGFRRNAEFVGCVGADGPRNPQYVYERCINAEQESHQENNNDSDREPFYCLIMFEDSEIVEEISIDEFHRHQPEMAFQFLESRLWLRIDKSSSRANGPK